jgi:glycosyltransferase involved in cell wall biosynthesis
VHVLFAGRLEPQKGADLLPEIWHAACAKASRPAQLTVLGDGSLRRMIEAHAVNDARMAIVPPVPRLADVLHGYDVLLMPSRFEGLGIVAVEAFMAGLSIVAFNAPGLREVVPASHPKLPQVGDVEALAALLAAAIDDPSRFRSPETERIVRERFAMAKMRQAYTEVYAKMISVTPRVLPSSRLEPKQDEGHC